MSRRFRIAWIVSTPTPYKLPLFARMHAHPDFDIRFLFMAENDPQRPWDLGDYDIDCRFLPGIGIRNSFRRRSYTRFNPGIIGELHREKYDLVVICGYDHLTTLTALLFCLLTRTPFFMWGESQVLKQRGAFKRFLKRSLLFPFLRKCRAALVTGSMAGKYWQEIGIAPEAIHIVANAPDAHAFERESRRLDSRRERIRESLGLDDRPAGLFVGRFVPAKAVDVLLNAMDRIPADSRPQLILVGEGPLRAGLETFARTRNLPVVFSGFRQPKELVRFYSAVDFFVLPSRREPWGVVVNEAMACGLPVILSRQVGAAWDLLEAGRNGFMVDSDDAGGLARAMETLQAMTREDRLKMGEISRKIALRWTHDQSLHNFIRALEQHAPGFRNDHDESR